MPQSTNSNATKGDSAVTAGPDATTPTRYRLDVIASQLADVVQHAGGWMFDHVVSGWDVTALLPECSDPRPLQILGVRVARLNGELVAGAQVANTIGVCAAFYRSRAGLRRYLGRAINHGSEVVLWPGEPGGQSVPAVGQVQHRLTRAACVFKAEALRALNLPRVANAEERFRCLTCNAAAVSMDVTSQSCGLPRRAFSCRAAMPVRAVCDDSADIATHSVECRAL